MGKQTVAIGVILLLGSLLLTAGALANGGPSIGWSVIGGGGGHAEAGSYAIDGTIGQSVVGTVSTGNYDLCSGFWCGGVVEYKIYLPLVLKNA
jgi:hypothetical protein